jgi:hypothetical protein
MTVSPPKRFTNSAGDATLQHKKNKLQKLIVIDNLYQAQLTTQWHENQMTSCGKVIRPLLHFELSDTFNQNRRLHEQIIRV